MRKNKATSATVERQASPKPKKVRSDVDQIISLLKKGAAVEDINNKLNATYTAQDIATQVMGRGYGIVKDLKSQRYFLKD